jgi:hypothetical protein
VGWHVVLRECGAPEKGVREKEGEMLERVEVHAEGTQVKAEERREVIRIPSAILKLKRILEGPDSFVEVGLLGVEVSDGHHILVHFPGATGARETFRFPGRALAKAKADEKTLRVYDEIMIVKTGAEVKFEWVEGVKVEGTEPTAVVLNPEPLRRSKRSDFPMIGISYANLKALIQLFEAATDPNDRNRTVLFLAPLNDRRAAYFLLDGSPLSPSGLFSVLWRD